MDLEPAYEEGVDAIGDLGGGFIDAYEVRKGLYWALFAGAHGHTFGRWPGGRCGITVGSPTP